jgi:glucose/arabinose dehydrogenase
MIESRIRRLCLPLLLLLVSCANNTPPAAQQRVVATAQPSPVANGPQALRGDITIRKVIDTGGGFRRLEYDPLTKEMYYMDGEANIFRLRVEPGAGSTGEKVYSYADIGGAQATAGMTFGPDGTLYVVGNETNGNTTQAIIRKGVPDEAGKRTWSTLASTEAYPRSNTPFDHVFNGIVVNPNGRYVYVSSGSRTDHGEEQDNKGTFPNTREVALTSAIMRLPTDGRDLVLPNDETRLRENGYVYADGTRNAYDLAFAPDGNLFAIDNGPDADYPEELNWIREGHHYGFPWRFGDQNNPQQFADYDPANDKLLPEGYTAVDSGTYHNDPQFPPPPMAFTDPVINRGPDADQFRTADGTVQRAHETAGTLATFTPHRSPLGLTFDTAQTLSDPLRGGAFVLSWGAVGGTLSDRGKDLLHLKLTQSGDRYEAQVTQIARNFASPIDSVLFEHQLYVLDSAEQGTIWEITLP